VSKRALLLAVLVGVVAVTLIGGPAFSEGPPPHRHLFVTGIEFDDDGWPVGFKKCRLLANGQPVPNNAHHDHRHIGKAAEMQWQRASSATVPLAPLAPWETCEEFVQMVFGG
jgi:hypothetical protein